MKKFLVIGDDLRSQFIREELTRRGNMVFETVVGKNKYDICILPLPLFRYPNIDYRQIFRQVKTNCPIFGGMVTAEIQDIAKLYDREIIDYYQNELLMQKNAYLTSEGAVNIAISNTDYSIYGSDILILGYGRIAKAVARALLALGANVSIFARKATDRESAIFYGYNAVSPAELQDIIGTFDILINTVPSILISEEEIARIRPNTLYIELASKPGGIESALGRERGIKIIDAQSLPSKTAPKTAAQVILDSIENILTERGKSL